MQLLGMASLLSVLLMLSSVKAAAPLEDRPGLRSSQELNKERKEIILKLLSGLLDSGNNQVGIESTFPNPEDMEEVKLEERSRFSQLPQRDRKAPCKNFFWKTFTSC
ncbi:somatostatin-1B-like [Pristis pectinata]|uniref:somatostatin-1B-like n=1 Tax=Pristis pectinata TaxID=685728 RepID=UPI00223CCDC0|nr:somatostatin-1B-like [Pristis pectinata]